MNDNNKCPCEAVEKLQEIVERHEKRLADGTTQFAVINTKLNLVVGIMAAIGVAICGVLVKLILHL